MRPTVRLDGLRKTKPSEFLIRFVFGGSMTAIAGLIAHGWGPAVGGLFLAFPAILPARLTLVATQDGRESAASESRGAVLGAMALGVFGATTWLLAERAAPVATLALATIAWATTAVLLWRIAHHSKALGWPWASLARPPRETRS